MIRLTMQLNAGFSGPQAWLLLAIARGYVAEAGVELALIPGNGAYNAAPGMAAKGCDLGYGDLHSLIEVHAADPERAPVGVFATFNASPSAIFVAAGSAIQGPMDLIGRRLIGHASDVALRTFRSFAACTGIDADAVTVATAEGGMAELVGRVVSGEADGLFAYVSTVSSALAAKGVQAEDALRWLRYDELVPDQHGSAVMASRRLMAEQPEVLIRVVAALNRGLAAALAEPEAVIDAVMQFAPGANRHAEQVRWDRTLEVEMAHPVARMAGYGDVDAERFARDVALHATTLGLAVPDVEDIFTSRFLPPLARRARKAVS